MYNRWIYVNFIQKYIHTEQFPCYIKWIFILLQNYELSIIMIGVGNGTKK